MLISLELLKKRSYEAVTSGLAVRNEATSMLNTVQNFMAVAAQAQNAANRALAKVTVSHSPGLFVFCRVGFKVHVNVTSVTLVIYLHHGSQ